MKRLGKVWSPICLFCMLAICLESAAGGPPPRWKTGSSFQRALAKQFEAVDWPQGSQLRQRLDRLAQWQQVSLFLDREIDPGESIKLSGRRISLAEMLDQVAGQVGGATTYIGSVVYIGPRKKVAVLSRIAQQRARETRDVQGKTRLSPLKPREWKWEELAEPHELLAQLAQEAGVEIEGMGQIPHDLWPQTDLPPLGWSDRLTIVLAGFGLTYQWDSRGKSVRLIPLPTPEVVTRSYETTLSQMNLEKIAQRFPHAEVNHSESGITFHGTADEHQRLEKLLTRQATTRGAPTSRAKKVHSLRVVKQPIGAILKTLERQLQLRFEFDEGVTEKLYTRVSFDLRDVSLDRLLDETLAPASLSYRRKDDAIIITAGQ